MANLFDTANKLWSSSTTEPDDISLFLHQFLLRSSSSSFLAGSDNAGLSNPEQATAPGLSRVTGPECCLGLNSSAYGDFSARYAGNVASSSFGTLDDPDEYDCESEETIEALVEEAAPNPIQQRNSTKRTRAAEVHNLSEKRRRSRINEKMKALQNLIPNSNKTDKASMLDEAIEYLKQLQLQVQMLTMRNGLSLYPLCLPRMLQQDQIPGMKTDDYDGSRPFTIAKELSFDQESTIEAILGLPDNFVRRGISRDGLMPCKDSGENWCTTTLADNLAQAKGISLVPFDAPPSSMKELEPCFTGDLINCGLHLSNLLNDQTFSSQLPEQTNDNSKTDRNGF